MFKKNNIPNNRAAWTVDDLLIVWGLHKRRASWSKISRQVGRTISACQGIYYTLTTLEQFKSKDNSEDWRASYRWAYKKPAYTFDMILKAYDIFNSESFDNELQKLLEINEPVSIEEPKELTTKFSYVKFNGETWSFPVVEYANGDKVIFISKDDFIVNMENNDAFTLRRKK